MPFIDITGNTYNRLTVLHEVLPRCKPIKWVCRCTCGNTKEVVGAHLKNGAIKSCGCLHVETNKKQFTKHGDYQGKLYAVYRTMIQRCSNPKYTSYKYYGGRGITFCSEWLMYSNFKDWALANGYQEGLTLERKDTNLGYAPSNCCWATRVQQSRNRRAMSGHTSKYIGVHWDASRKKWMASIGIQGKTIALGRHPSEEEAAKVRDNYIIENNLNGFVLNFT